ncbi:MAG: hypothetical protein A2X49_05520 [Lentisphaerae bacterium GWF2_52_8]|nr:MAG: hypothetical protein A2X49_05520 [Lentisphaerae bacterium GWF2_52_8]
MAYDIDLTAKYFDEHASTYSKQYETPAEFEPNQYRMDLVKEIIAGLKPGVALDAGCGAGDLLLHLAKLGFEVSGADLSGGMASESCKRLASAGFPGAKVIKAPLDDMGTFGDAQFDYIFCLGVFPYIPEEDNAKCYRELRRLLKKGGLLISAHVNELFDAFTFNKYTIRFFEKNLWPLFKDSSELGLDELKERLASLICNPDKPVNKNPDKSARDIIFTRGENPITFPEKLACHGFAHKSNAYYHFHALPPLLRNGNEALMLASKSMEGRCSKAWQGVFLASTFVNISTAV